MNLTLNQRKIVERNVVTLLCRAMISNGYKVVVHADDESAKFDDVDAAVEFAMKFDQVHLVASHQGMYQGGVIVLFGEQGHDCISDYSEVLEENGIVTDAMNYCDAVRQSGVAHNIH